MPRSAKPGVDWVEIEKRVKAGEPYRKIAADPAVDVSHVRISQRAREYGWHHERKVSKALARANGKPDWKAKIEATETARMHRAPATAGERRSVSLGKRCPEHAEAILESLESGLTENVAASLVGISPGTLSAWKHEDTVFGELMRLARLRSKAAPEINVRQASERGDWKASLAILQGDKDTRDYWGGNDKGAGPSFSININLREPLDEQSLEPPTIEVRHDREQEPD